ncbi:MAG: hypothetical protein DGJ47_000142 [Rickettsiaceae bacterium]
MGGTSGIPKRIHELRQEDISSKQKNIADLKYDSVVAFHKICEALGLSTEEGQEANKLFRQVLNEISKLNAPNDSLSKERINDSLSKERIKDIAQNVSKLGLELGVNDGGFYLTDSVTLKKRDSNTTPNYPRFTTTEARKFILYTKNRFDNKSDPKNKNFFDKVDDELINKQFRDFRPLENHNVGNSSLTGCSKDSKDTLNTSIVKYFPEQRIEDKLVYAPVTPFDIIATLNKTTSEETKSSSQYKETITKLENLNFDGDLIINTTSLLRNLVFSNALFQAPEVKNTIIDLALNYASFASPEKYLLLKKTITKDKGDNNLQFIEELLEIKKYISDNEQSIKEKIPGKITRESFEFFHHFLLGNRLATDFSRNITDEDYKEQLKTKLNGLVTMDLSIIDAYNVFFEVQELLRILQLTGPDDNFDDAKYQEYLTTIFEDAKERYNNLNRINLAYRSSEDSDYVKILWVYKKEIAKEQMLKEKEEGQPTQRAKKLGYLQEPKDINDLQKDEATEKLAKQMASDKKMAATGFSYLSFLKIFLDTFKKEEFTSEFTKQEIHKLKWGLLKYSIKSDDVKEEVSEVQELFIEAKEEAVANNTVFKTIIDILKYSCHFTFSLFANNGDSIKDKWSNYTDSIGKRIEYNQKADSKVSWLEALSNQANNLPQSHATKVKNTYYMQADEFINQHKLYVAAESNNIDIFQDNIDSILGEKSFLQIESS